jgi:cytochrome c-type biogenesis protein CcmF
VTLGACLALGYRGGLALATYALCGFVVVVTIRELLLPARQRMSSQKEGFGTAFLRSASRSRRRTGGYIIHLGIVVIALGVAASAAWKVHATATLKPGQTMQVGQYQVQFDGLESGSEGNRDWQAANVTVIAPDGTRTEHHGIHGPRMNYYASRTEPVGSPSVQEMVFRDVYVSLLSFDKAANTASYNAWVFPMVGWIWYSLPFLVIGMLIAVWPQRKRREAEADAPAGAVASGSP